MRARTEPSLLARAVGLLARREYTRAQLTSRLSRYAESQEAVSAVLDQLQQRGLLSDQRYVEARTRTLARKFGAARIRHDLETAGAAALLIEEAMAGIGDDEFSRAQAVWQSRFAAAPGDRTEWARQGRFLQSRGFDFEVIRRVLKSPPVAAGDDNPGA